MVCVLAVRECTSSLLLEPYKRPCFIELNALRSDNDPSLDRFWKTKGPLTGSEIYRNDCQQKSLWSAELCTLCYSSGEDPSRA